ncbi:right-handed parallel beta-helix repeat-containing protein [Spirosoma soli]|uniref:Right-handed parallel beta-helix repeat-containing protein n=1 Tax=Spirosoma soli TaxID=1770529 RepID=A0ABW5LWW4_9BACT
MFFANKQGQNLPRIGLYTYSPISSIGYWLANILLVTALAPALGQTTYYVASSGNDANNGQSINTPFQTITKVNSLPLQAGDAVLFRRGDTFRGTLTIRQSGVAGKPIVVDAYGSGNKPIIAGSAVLTNWMNVGGNIWQAPCAACGNQITGIYRNNFPLPLGRYPNLNAANKGYLTIESHSGKTQLTSREPLTTNWTGGEAVVRPVQWILDRAIISQQSGNTLTLVNNSGYNLTDGWGYFIQNHPATLDQTDEWYYDPTAKTVRLYYDRGNPNDQAITATAFDMAVSVVNAKYVTIRNLQITQARSTGLYASNTSDLILSNNDITNVGEDAVTIDGTGANLGIENNLINRANNNGLVIRQYTNVTVRGNAIRRVGLVPGRSKSGDGQALGLHSAGTGGILIEDNVLDSLGYNGIVFTNNAIIRRNTISSFCLTKSDGGGIYTWNGNKQGMSNVSIQANIIYNGVGAPEGAPNGAYSGANGIYMDDCAQNVDLSSNTVFDCSGLGIYLHATNNITVTNNTSFNNRESQFTISHNNGACPARNNLVQNNLFVGKSQHQLVANYESTSNDLVSYGTFDKNVYARPFDDLFKIRAVSNNGNGIVGSDLTLSEWRSRFQQDPDSKDSPVSYKGYVIKSLSNTYRLNNKFASTNEGWSTWGPYGNGQAVFDNTNRLDDGSLRVSFPNSSGKSDSYMIVTNGVGTVGKAKSYLLRFDAIASAEGKKVQVFLRQQDGPYYDVSNRSTILATTVRKSYEVAFTATADEAKTIVVFQVTEDGQTVWLDNIRLQEGVVAAVNPSDSIRLVYNPTRRDSVISLETTYQDVRYNQYRNQIKLAPFTSLVLFKTTSSVTTESADLTLSMQIDKRCLAVGNLAWVSVRLRNRASTKADAAVQAQWSCQLPPNLQVVQSNGLRYSNGTLTGNVQSLRLLADTTFLFQVKPVVAGLYRLSAQVTAASLPDPNSTPDSGTADGEDDSAMIDFRVGEPTEAVFTSPNPNQRALPAVVSAQPLPDANTADLCLRMDISGRVVAINELVTCTITISNNGGAAANTVQVQNLLPDGLEFASGETWTSSGKILSCNLGIIAAGQTASRSFRARVTSKGALLNQAQISLCSTTDCDSSPGNGFNKGEDDQAQIDILVK